MGLHLRDNLSGTIINFSDLYAEAKVNAERCNQELDSVLFVPVDNLPVQEINGRQFYALPRNIIVPTVEKALASQALCAERHVQLQAVLTKITQTVTAPPTPTRKMPAAGKARKGYQKYTDQQIMQRLMLAAHALKNKGKPLTTKVIGHLCPFKRQKGILKRMLAEGLLAFASYERRIGIPSGGHSTRTVQLLTVGPNGRKRPTRRTP